MSQTFPVPAEAELIADAAPLPRVARAVATPPLSIAVQRWLLWATWRSRHLAIFILIGVASLALEAAMLEYLVPHAWTWPVRAGISFSVGMLFAAVLNVYVNFNVLRRNVLRTLLVFALVSTASFALNVAISSALKLWDVVPYSVGRFATSGVLFGAAYAVHRAWTFRRMSRNLGLALYLNEGSDDPARYAALGDMCDHVHFDLLDETYDREAPAIDASKMRIARRLWRWQPFCLHIMSRRPLAWVDQLWREVDWIVFHIDGEDDPLEVIAACRERGRKVGVVWHESVTLGRLLPYLPHVDFVLVLGISRPGRSGQPVQDEALAMAQQLVELEKHYNYRTIFDGGVSSATLPRIPAQIVVSSSAVLRAEHPVRAALTLMGGGE